MAHEQYLSEEYKEVQTYTKQQNLNKARRNSFRCKKYNPYQYTRICKENIYKFYDNKKFSRSGKKFISCLEIFCKIYNYLTKF